MLGVLIVGGITYFILSEMNDRPAEPNPDPSPVPDPEPTPQPDPVDFTEYAVWSGEANVGSDVVWTFQKMLRYSDGSTIENGSEYIVVGNANHTSFLRVNSDRGSIDIPARLTGGDVDQENVMVFASIEDAVADLEEEEEDRPGSPEKQPEDGGGSDGSGGLPSLPVQPDYGFGGSGLFQNGGL